MDSQFLKLLKGELEGDEIEISLKSLVPVCVVYPELYLNTQVQMTHLMEFYKEDHDYNDLETPLIIPELKEPKTLLIIFTRLFEVIIKMSNSGETEVVHIPKIILNVDIGSSASSLEVIRPPQDEVDNFDGIKNKMYSFTGFLAVGDAANLTEAQKHNLRLFDIIKRKTNNNRTKRSV